MATQQQWLSPATMTAWRAFLELGARITPLVEDQLHRDGGLSHAQYGILLSLQAEPQGLTMSEIARAVFVSKSGLTYQVGKLEERGLVACAVDPDDERRRVVRIVRAGLDALDAVRPGHVALIRTHFQDAVGDDIDAVARALVAARDSLGEGR